MKTEIQISKLGGMTTKQNTVNIFQLKKTSYEECLEIEHYKTVFYFSKEWKIKAKLAYENQVVTCIDNNCNEFNFKLISN